MANKITSPHALALLFEDTTNLLPRQSPGILLQILCRGTILTCRRPNKGVTSLYRPGALWGGSLGSFLPSTKAIKEVCPFLPMEADWESSINSHALLGHAQEISITVFPLRHCSESIPILVHLWYRNTSPSKVHTILSRVVQGQCYLRNFWAAVTKYQRLNTL